MHTRHRVSFGLTCQRLGGQQKLQPLRIELAPGTFFLIYVSCGQITLSLFLFYTACGIPILSLYPKPQLGSGEGRALNGCSCRSLLNRAPLSGVLDSNISWMHSPNVDALVSASLLEPLLFTKTSPVEEVRSASWQPSHPMRTTSLFFPCGFLFLLFRPFESQAWLLDP